MKGKIRNLLKNVSLYICVVVQNVKCIIMHKKNLKQTNKHIFLREMNTKLDNKKNKLINL